MFRAAPSSTHDGRCSIQEGGINRKTVDSTKQCTCAFAALTSLRLRRGVSTCTSNLRRCACDRLASFRACARVCAGFAHIVISVRAPRISSSLRGLRAYARVRASSARMLVSAGPPRVCSCLRGLRAYARLCAATRVSSSLRRLRACARLCAGSARMLVSARTPRVCSSLRELRTYAPLCAGFARMLVSAWAPRVCSCLRGLRAYARVCAGFAHIVISVRAPRISSSLRGLRAYARVRASSARASELSDYLLRAVEENNSKAHARGGQGPTARGIRVHPRAARGPYSAATSAPCDPTCTHAHLRANGVMIHQLIFTARDESDVSVRGVHLGRVS